MIPTTRVTMKIGGAIFTNFVQVQIERDLQTVAGRFNLTAFDAQRSGAAFPSPLAGIVATVLANGNACTLAIDNETVLTGWIDRVGYRARGDQIGVTVAGRDKAGDLVDCAALPNGPADFNNIGLLALARQICAPFKITASTDIDLGAPFTRLSMHPHETAVSFLEKAGRQRAALLVSDGLGGIVFTRGGSARAPDSIREGENAQLTEVSFNWQHRFSDYFVKGQTAAAGGARTGVSAPMTHATVPPQNAASPATAPGAHSQTEAKGVVMTGHAIDPEITRWRPTVNMVRSQSGMSSVQEQAEWALRVARGKAEQLHYRALDWRAGAQSQLWRPNAVASVFDAFAGIDKEMLIAGVSYGYGAEGTFTMLRVVGRTAYDLIDEPSRQRPRHVPHRRRAPGNAAPLITTVPLGVPLGAPQVT